MPCRGGEDGVQAVNPEDRTLSVRITYIINDHWLIRQYLNERKRAG